MAISQVEVEPEDIFEKVRGKAITKVKELLRETYARHKEDFRSDLAEALDIEEDELPKFEVEVRVTIGKQFISVSGFEAEEKDEDEDDEDE
jgi:hypothetical protein